MCTSQGLFPPTTQSQGRTIITKADWKETRADKHHDSAWLCFDSCVWGKLRLWACCFWIAEVWPCFINTDLSPATHFTLARQPFHFIPGLCKLASMPTDFAPAQTTQKLWCWEEPEKSLCAVLCHLPIQHNQREMMPCSTQMTHLMCDFVLLTLKSPTLPPKCHCCPPFRCHSSPINKWQEIS